MGNIYKGHILRGTSSMPRQHEKKTYTVEISEYKQNGKFIGYTHGETLEKARIEARKKVDEVVASNK